MPKHGTWHKAYISRISQHARECALFYWIELKTLALLMFVLHDWNNAVPCDGHVAIKTLTKRRARHVQCAICGRGGGATLAVSASQSVTSPTSHRTHSSLWEGNWKKHFHARNYIWAGCWTNCKPLVALAIRHDISWIAIQLTLQLILVVSITWSS